MVLWLMENIDKILSFEKNIKRHDDNYHFKDIKIESEVPIKSSMNFIAGYGDIIHNVIYENDDYAFEYVERTLIEVKPYIDSFGAVLRQIKTYENFIDTVKNPRTGYRINKLIENYQIFTLDTRFDAQFESQGISVLHPPKDFDIQEVMDYYGLS